MCVIQTSGVCVSDLPFSYFGVSSIFVWRNPGGNAVRLCLLRVKLFAVLVVPNTTGRNEFKHDGRNSQSVLSIVCHSASARMRASARACMWVNIDQKPVGLLMPKKVLLLLCKVGVLFFIMCV